MPFRYVQSRGRSPVEGGEYLRLCRLYGKGGLACGAHGSDMTVSLSLTSGFPGTAEANHTAPRGAIVGPTTAPRGEGGGEAFCLLVLCSVVLCFLKVGVAGRPLL